MGLNKLVFLLGIIIIPFITKAQTMRLQDWISEKVDTLSPLENETIGPNLRHFASFYVGYGLPLGFNFDNNYKSLGSSVECGVFYKRKLTGAFSIIADANWQRNRINRVENWVSIPEYKLYYQKEIFNHFGAATGLRVNIDPKRGNIVGTYIEFKVLATYVATSVFKIKDGYFGNQFVNTNKYKAIEYNQRVSTGYQIAIGRGRSSFNLAVLSPIAIGIVRVSPLVELKTIPMLLTYRINFI